MKLYKISQDENNGYDTYDSAVVIAESEDEARLIHPYHSSYEDSPYFWRESDEKWCYKADGEIVCTWTWDSVKYGTSEWTSPEFVQVQYLGEAREELDRQIVCASFNAG